MKRPKALKNKSSGTGNFRQRLQAAKTRKRIAERNYRLRHDAAFKAEYDAKQKAYQQSRGTR